MKYRKNVRFLFALAAAALALTGCAKKETAGKSGEVKMETVRVWTNDAPYQAILEPFIKAYNEGQGLKDGINIEYKVFGGDYHDVLKVALAADQGPELFKFVGTVKEPFIKSNWMLPLDDLPGGTEFLARYSPILLKGYNTFDGKTYSVPFKVLTTKFIYNKDLLAKSGIAEPPRTWDDVYAYARKVTKDNKGEAYGYGVHLKDAASSGKWYFATQFATSVGHMGYDFRQGRYSFSEFGPILRKIIQMRDEKILFPGGEGMGNDELRAQFAAGRIAMLTGVSWDVSGLHSLGMNFKLGVCDTPVLDPARKYKNYAQIADVLCVGPSARKLPEKAMKVYALMHSDEVQLAIQNQEVDFMALESIQKQASGNFKMAGTAEFGDTSNSYFTMTPPDGMITVEGQPYQNTIINLIGAGKPSDVDKVLADLDQRYNSQLDKAVAAGLDLGPYVNAAWDTSSKK
jgi:multiple sugar transport system substrate-binding protein